MTQRLLKLDARIEIISILVSEVGVLGNTPPTEVPFASYCEAAFSRTHMESSLICPKKELSALAWHFPMVVI